jgi:hypothetical protein
VRAAGLIVAFLVVVGLGVFTAVYYLGGQNQLTTVHYSASGGQVNVVLQEDPQNDSSSKPDWVSYYVQDPANQQWVHTTLFSVPANTTVNVTIYGYDGCTPLRNNFFSQVQGTIGGTVDVTQFDQHGKQYASTPNTPVIDSWADCNVGHTFAIPDLGVYVPVASPTRSYRPTTCALVRRAPRAATPTRWRSSASRHPPPAASTGGSAWCPAAADTSTATAAPCRAWAT